MELFEKVSENFRDINFVPVFIGGFYLLGLDTLIRLLINIFVNCVKSKILIWWTTVFNPWTMGRGYRLSPYDYGVFKRYNIATMRFTIDTYINILIQYESGLRSFSIKRCILQALYTVQC